MKYVIFSGDTAWPSKNNGFAYGVDTSYHDVMPGEKIAG